MKHDSHIYAWHRSFMPTIARPADEWKGVKEGPTTNTITHTNTPILHRSGTRDALLLFEIGKKLALVAVPPLENIFRT